MAAARQESLRRTHSTTIAGLDGVVVEAREHIGDRIFTRRDSATPVPIELAAEFICGNAPELTHVLYEASLSSVDVGGARRSAVRRDYPPGVRLELSTNVCEKSDLHVVSVTVV